MQNVRRHSVVLVACQLVSHSVCLTTRPLVERGGAAAATTCCLEQRSASNSVPDLATAVKQHTIGIAAGQANLYPSTITTCSTAGTLANSLVSCLLTELSTLGLVKRDTPKQRMAGFIEQPLRLSTLMGRNPLQWDSIKTLLQGLVHTLQCTIVGAAKLSVYTTVTTVKQTLSKSNALLSHNHAMPGSWSTSGPLYNKSMFCQQTSQGGDTGSNGTTDNTTRG